MSETLVISIIMLGTISVIIIIMVQSVKKQKIKKTRKLEAKLAQLIVQRQLIIDKKQQLHNRLLATDTTGQTLIHLWLESDTPTFELINLNNVRKSEIIKLYSRITEKSSKDKNHIHEHITAIHLQLTTDNNVFIIPFYSEIDDGIFEMQPLTKQAEEWNICINSNI